MFAPPVAKPKAKTTSNDMSQLGRDRLLGSQRDSGDVKRGPDNPEHDAGAAGMSSTGGLPGRSWNFCLIPAHSDGREQPFQMPPLATAPRVSTEVKFEA